MSSGGAPHRTCQRKGARRRLAGQDTTGRSTTVKYMLIIYGNAELWNSFDPAEFGAWIKKFDEFNKKHYASVELLGAYGVADAPASRLVTVTDGQPAVTDGPYLETKEHLASWYL